LTLQEFSENNGLKKTLGNNLHPSKLRFTEQSLTRRKTFNKIREFLDNDVANNENL
jgi:hypothetical protein